MQKYGQPCKQDASSKERARRLFKEWTAGKDNWQSFRLQTRDPSPAQLRNVEYSILLVMSELSTVQFDRALGLWL